MGANRGDVGKTSRVRCGFSARVIVTEPDLINAPHRGLKDPEMNTIETLGTAATYVTTTGNCDIITFEHMQKMKDQAIVCNIGHFDNEIQMDGLTTKRRPDTLCP